MKSIKITINGSNKFKLKVSSKKAKDIKITCSEEFVADTITLFKTPEKLVLNEHNVGYLAGVCETHKLVLDVKPVFLKRISNLQSEIDSILHFEKTEMEGSSVEEAGKESQQATQVLQASQAPTEKVTEKKLENSSKNKTEEKEEEKQKQNSFPLCFSDMLARRQMQAHVYTNTAKK